MKFDKQKVMKVLPFIILGYFFNKVSQAFTTTAGTELGDKIMNGMDSLGEVFLNPLPSFNPIDILIGIAGGVIIKLAIYIKGKDAKKYRKGCEYGSARWGNAEDIKPYMANKFEDNVILTETERLTMDGRPKAGPKYARNKNILVIGGSYSGKYSTNFLFIIGESPSLIKSTLSSSNHSECSLSNFSKYLFESLSQP